MPEKGHAFAEIQKAATSLGFELAGIVEAGASTTFEQYQDWLTRGYAGEMGYLARPDAVAKRQNPDRILPGARTILVVGQNYHTRPLPEALRDDPSRGIVASYAWGSDYHDVMLPRLRQLAAIAAESSGQPAAYRAYVDTGPLLERELAARAGLGFIGRNTNLIHPRRGSWLFLGAVLLTAEFATDPSPASRGTCGRCTRCLEACPTAAFPRARVLDARRCISYLTIELKGPIPRELRPAMGNRIFGCDICQEVCPWNRRFAQPTAEPAYRAGSDTMAPRLLDLMALDETSFRQGFRDSPIQRAKRRGLLRNVAVALGNWADPVAVPALSRALHDPEPLVRGHVAWALGQIEGQPARQAVVKRMELEGDPWVRQELELALAGPA
ncbi:MAG: tRNA epoxyqueuosine(34) reductase QueG [Anaerolineae bacterium]|nr:tRNA epoxyqueuosine(34) reductase QueG [Anaerolineae bacterium]